MWYCFYFIHKHWSGTNLFIRTNFDFYGVYGTRRFIFIIKRRLRIMQPYIFLGLLGAPVIMGKWRFENIWSFACICVYVLHIYIYINTICILCFCWLRELCMRKQGKHVFKTALGRVVIYVNLWYSTTICYILGMKIVRMNHIFNTIKLISPNKYSTIFYICRCIKQMDALHWVLSGWPHKQRGSRSADCGRLLGCVSAGDRLQMPLCRLCCC